MNEWSPKDNKTNKFIANVCGIILGSSSFPFIKALFTVVLALFAVNIKVLERMKVFKVLDDDEIRCFLVT